MSLWRRIAIEKLPELQCKIANGGSAYNVWLELHDEFNRAYSVEPRNESLISRIYEYAVWCSRQPHNADLRTAVTVCFYETLPLDIVVRGDLSRWLSPDEFAALRPVFGYHLSESEIKRLAEDFIAETSRRDWHRRVSVDVSDRHAR